MDELQHFLVRGAAAGACAFVMYKMVSSTPDNLFDIVFDTYIETNDKRNKNKLNEKIDYRFDIGLKLSPQNTLDPTTYDVEQDLKTLKQMYQREYCELLPRKTFKTVFSDQFKNEYIESNSFRVLQFNMLADGLSGAYCYVPLFFFLLSFLFVFFCFSLYFVLQKTQTNDTKFREISKTQTTKIVIDLKRRLFAFFHVFFVCAFLKCLGPRGMEDDKAFIGIDKRCLEWRYRGLRILEEIMRSKADLICMQECDRSKVCLFANKPAFCFCFCFDFGCVFYTVLIVSVCFAVIFNLIFLG